MVAVIQLQRVLFVYLVVAPGRQTYPVGMHPPLIPRVVEYLGIGERANACLPDLVGEGEHAAEIVLGMLATCFVCALETFAERQGEVADRVVGRGVDVVAVPQFFGCFLPAEQHVGDACLEVAVESVVHLSGGQEPLRLPEVALGTYVFFHQEGEAAVYLPG